MSEARRLRAREDEKGRLKRMLADTMLDNAASSARKLVKIGAKVVSDGRYVTCQMAEVAAPRQMFAEILLLIARLSLSPAPA